MSEELKWPEKLTYYHSKKGYPENCVEAANKMHDAFMKVINARANTQEKHYDKRSYAMGWWNAMSACRDYGIPTNTQEKDKEETYPCSGCGILRTKAEGGTTFTLCDTCWEKYHEKPMQTSGFSTKTPKFPPHIDDCDILYPCEQKELAGDENIMQSKEIIRVIVELYAEEHGFFKHPPSGLRS